MLIMLFRSWLLLAWAILATALILWGLLDQTPWQKRTYRCHDALIGLRSSSSGYAIYYHEQVERWCGK